MGLIVGNGIWIGRNRGGAAPNGSPSLLTATTISDTRIDLAWTIGSNNHDGHYLQQSANGLTGWSTIYTATGSTHAYSNTGLTPYTMYYYRVVAFKGLELSNYSNTANAITTEPSIINTANSLIWLNHLDLTTITKDGGIPDKTSEWRDKRGSGRKVVNADPATQMPYSATDGIGGYPTFLKLAANLNLYQPSTFYLLFKAISYGGEEAILAAESNNFIIKFNSTTQIAVFAGGSYQVVGGLPTANTYWVLTVCFNGASSWVQIDGGARQAVTCGTGHMAGLFWLNNRSTYGAGRCSFKEVIIRNNAESEENGTIINDYLKKKK